MINGQGPTINISEMENLKCDHCGNIYFIDVHVIKIIPKLLVGATEDQKQMLDALQCSKCGYVPNGEVFDVKPKLKLS